MLHEQGNADRSWPPVVGQLLAACCTACTCVACALMHDICSNGDVPFALLVVGSRGVELDRHRGRLLDIRSAAGAGTLRVSVDTVRKDCKKGKLCRQ